MWHYSGFCWLKTEAILTRNTGANAGPQMSIFRPMSKFQFGMKIPLPKYIHAVTSLCCFPDLFMMSSLGTHLNHVQLKDSQSLKDIVLAGTGMSSISDSRAQQGGHTTDSKHTFSPGHLLFTSYQQQPHNKPPSAANLMFGFFLASKNLSKWLTLMNACKEYAAGRIWLQSNLGRRRGWRDNRGGKREA